jgi:hypothetical protein
MVVQGNINCAETSSLGMFNLIDTLKKYTFFKLAVIYSRYLIGFAFVFASLVKIKGERFTSISPTEPIGYFFEAMYQTGYYWNFLGWAQFVAGTLMMTQRFALIGTMMFLPIILNVFMITHAINFGSGTPVITSLMLFGTVALLFWDYKKWIILVQRDHTIKLDLTHVPEDKFMDHPIWIITGVAFVSLTLIPWLTDFRQMLIWVSTMLMVGFLPLIVIMVRLRAKKFLL